MSFASLATAAGERYAPFGTFLFTCRISRSVHRFRNDCKEAGKEIMVWTVNEVAHMMEVRPIPLFGRNGIGNLGLGS